MTIRDTLEVSAAVAESCGSSGWVMALVNQDVDGKALLGIPYEENITPLI
jgi:hypothetical protein